MPLTSLALSLVGLCLGVEEPDEAPQRLPFPLQLEQGLSDCAEGCFRAESGGALLCLEHHEDVNCGTCKATWFTPDGPHREPTWAPLVTCANGAAKVHKAAAASVNGRAQKAAPVAPVFSHAPWIDGRFEAARSTTGEVTFEVTAEHLRVLRGDTVVDQVAWTPSTRPSLTPKESAHVEIYRLGKGWLAVIGYRASPLGTASPTRWVKLGLGRDSSLDPTPLATDKSLLAHCPVPDDEDGLPACPATYETLTPYLAHYCAGTLTQGHLAAIAQLARGLDLEIALTADALVALFNMHGAMYGYAFKQKNLGAFFYGPPQHLPEACRPLVKRYGRVSDVPATFDEGRDVARRLWKDRAAR